MALIGDPANKVHHPTHLRAGEIDREKHDFEALFMSKLGSFDRGLNGFFKRPFVSIFNNMRT